MDSRKISSTAASEQVNCENLLNVVFAVVKLINVKKIFLKCVAC